MQNLTNQEILDTLHELSRLNNLSVRTATEEVQIWRLEGKLRANKGEEV